jgi:nitroreductase
MDLSTVDHLLTTTRSVRKRLDLTRPVEPEVIERCIEIASQAPTGSNRQGWHFMVITEPDKRTRVAEFYKKSFDILIDSRDNPLSLEHADTPHPPGQMTRVRDSAIYLSEHMHEVPVLIIPCILGRVEEAGVMAQAGLYGSILPAAWSLMLALRARGLGSAWTTVHLQYEREVAALLDIPDNITQAALLPVAYFKGTDFKPAKRLPSQNFTHWNVWGQQRQGVDAS